MTRYRALCLAFVLAGVVMWQADSYFQIKRNFTLFSEVYSEISRRYVDDVEAGAMLRNGINAMLELLDPYTVLMDDGNDMVMDMMLRGTYTGVGIEVGARGSDLVIIAPLEGYSAFEKGIRAGDVIQAVDGIQVQGFSVEDLYNVLKGEVGTDVSLTIRRSGFDGPLEFLLTRAKVSVTNVSHSGWIDKNRGVAYVSLAMFGLNSAAEIRQAMTELQIDRPIESLVLDLRNNPGGLLDEAVKLVDLFLKPGELVVKTHGRAVETREEYKTREPVFFAGPVVVLQNEGSASASEIVSGALQDLDRAVILGERSFGKGLVQIVRPLSYNTALKLTVSRYYTPSGRSIQALQYLHNGEEARTLPDSLRNRFKTRNGRIVKDGLGIEPDIPTASSTSERLDVLLRQGGYYFRFANAYRAKHDSYPMSALPDAAYAQFKEWLASDGFQFETRSMALLNELQGSVPESERARNADGWKRIENQLLQLRDTDVVRLAPVVKASLHEELYSRYVGKKVLVDYRLSVDPLVLAARDLFNNPVRYASILSGRP
jgi:carboxyl-terminal processing protease